MKKILAFILAFMMVAGLCSCAKQGVAEGEAPETEPKEILNIKTLAGNGADGENTAAQSDIHVHGPAEEGSNITAEPIVGYCGNIQTTVYVGKEKNKDGYTFMSGDSVALTDILINLKYDGEICDCMPEFTVETEIKGTFGVNLTKMYARNAEGQAALTKEQTAKIKEIYDRQCNQGTTRP